MKPIQEPLVLESLNASRFGENTHGYVVMDGANYLGHVLFTVENDLTTVQECSLAENVLVDGGVRACVAAGEAKGAKLFLVNFADESLAKWWNVFCKNTTNAQLNEKLLYSCK